VYTVSTTGQLLPTPTEHDQQLWDLFVRIASIDTINERLASFEIFNDASNDSAASVWQSESNREKWHMNVNAAFEDDQKDLIHTMVHEYGHIVSLNTSQVRTTQGSCPRLELPEGCTKQGSYIDSFNQKFWAQYGTNAPEDYGSDQGQVDAFYNASPDSFVTEYAATNMVEDFAESWAYFVLRSKPSDDSEKSQKIRFMYEFKELVRERDRIRTQIRSDLQRRNLLH
ncbi:hypothetical protein KBD87_01600, partial [Candidatus Saccharibacteria bacterium]|nr:hypothetical protein [Candidatus Saccharibacteria bacterium]